MEPRGNNLRFHPSEVNDTLHGVNGAVRVSIAQRGKQAGSVRIQGFGQQSNDPWH